jgi:hypothetical protein
MKDEKLAPLDISRKRVTQEFRNVVHLAYPSALDVLKMIAELRREREQIDGAIKALQRLVRGHGKWRGRPPAWTSAQKEAPKRRGHPPGIKNAAD